METLYTFLLKASSGIVLFYVVYWLFLRKETFYSANRWFLIGALFTAIILPFFPVQYTVLVESEERTTAFNSIANTFQNIPIVSQSETTTETFTWQQAILLVYLIGAGIFLLRLLTQTFILIHLIIKYRIKSLDGVRIVENEKYGLPFSFFNIVFINPKFHTQEDLPEILAHEKVHIHENHWFDLLFIELLTVIFWFNPFIWFFERSIKQNHEYLADKGVLAQGHTVGRYQALLVNQLMGMQIIGITNNLNFALNTNRLKMMTKKKTTALGRVKLMWALPAIALLLFAFAKPQYRVKDVEPRGMEVATQEAPSQKTVKLAGLVVDENGDPLPGTSVVIKGGIAGTVCDLDGTFSIEVMENTGIVLSFVGKETIVDSYAEITSGKQNDGAFTRKYKMEDAVQIIHNSNFSGEQLPPPPPLSVEEIELKEKLTPPPPPVKESKLKEKLASPPPPPPAKKGNEEVFYIVEDMPQFPGGYYAMQDYISKMQKKIAVSKKVKGKAKVAFTVNGRGKVTDIKVVEKDNDGAAKGAVTLASSMPDWTPGKQRRKPVPVKFMMPVEFK